MRRERQGRKGKIYPTERRAPENRRDKKAFFNERCKEKEENNRMGKTRDFFKKIKDTKDGIKDTKDGKDTTQAWHNKGKTQ